MPHSPPSFAFECNNIDSPQVVKKIPIQIEKWTLQSRDDKTFFSSVCKCFLTSSFPCFPGRTTTIRRGVSATLTTGATRPTIKRSPRPTSSSRPSSSSPRPPSYSSRFELTVQEDLKNMHPANIFFHDMIVKFSFALIALPVPSNLRRAPRKPSCPLRWHGRCLRLHSRSRRDPSRPNQVCKHCSRK